MMALRVEPDPARTYFAPQFEIVLKGQRLDPFVVRDVLEVTYTDDVDNLDFFEFTLADWDPVTRLPKYSSPWTKEGQPVVIDGQKVPNFEPGADLELRLGYQTTSPLTLMLKGEVVSITPNFPAAGAPTCRVRVLNYLDKLRRAKVTGTFTGKPIEIAALIAHAAGVGAVQLPAGGPTGESRQDALANVVALDEIRRRAKDANLLVRLEEEANGTTTLAFDPPFGKDPVVSLAWGVNLINFAPQLSTRRAVETVIVRNVDPNAEGGAQRIEEHATWSDLPKLDPAALGPRGIDEIQSALRGNVEEITSAEVRSKEAAKELAIKTLEAIASELVQGSGSTVGDPRLRAGAVIEIAGLGPRFSGNYRLKQTTHSIGGAGYTTSFSANKLVFA